MMRQLSFAKTDQPETDEQQHHAENANNVECTAAEPHAAAHDGPQAAGETSSRSDDQDDPKRGVVILSHLLGRTESDLDIEIVRLKAQREAMKQDKKRCAAELKNTERKRTRLKNRAKLLSTHDLLDETQRYTRLAGVDNAREEKVSLRCWHPLFSSVKNAKPGSRR